MSAPSLGVVCNFYREKFALPSFLQVATSGFFDEVVMVSSPPSSEKPDEESIELVKAAGVRLVHTTIDAGFGVVRTRCIRETKCEFAMIMDADEHFHPIAPLMRCEGTEKYPENPSPNLSVFRDREGFDQGALLKDLINHAGGKDAIRLSRRHWFNAPGEFSKPCQNWAEGRGHPDWQLRLVRNSPYICYDPDVRMHERLLTTRTWGEPEWISGDTAQGPFVDHYHFWAKEQDPEGRRIALEAYEKLHHGSTTTMWTRTGFEE